jgi:hypothetical protein
MLSVKMATKNLLGIQDLAGFDFSALMTLS